MVRQFAQGKSLPKHLHRKEVKIYMKKPLVVRLDELAEKSGKSRSELIEGLLEASVLSDKGYANYMMREAQLSAAYWAYEFERASHKDQIRKDALTLQESLIFKGGAE